MNFRGQRPADCVALGPASANASASAEMLDMLRAAEWEYASASASASAATTGERGVQASERRDQDPDEGEDGEASDVQSCASYIDYVSDDDD